MLTAPKAREIAREAKEKRDREIFEKIKSFIEKRIELSASDGYFSFYYNYSVNTIVNYSLEEWATAISKISKLLIQNGYDVSFVKNGDGMITEVQIGW
ncbi:hypothetical protein IJD44_00855 [bacterium]|nr:hypothetical protein [bacterium]